MHLRWNKATRLLLDFVFWCSGIWYLWRRSRCSAGRSPIAPTHSLLTSAQNLLLNLTCVLLDCGRKAEHPEKTGACTRRTDPRRVSNSAPSCRVATSGDRITTQLIRIVHGKISKAHLAEYSFSFTTNKQTKIDSCAFYLISIWFNIYLAQYFN